MEASQFEGLGLKFPVYREESSLCSSFFNKDHHSCSYSDPDLAVYSIFYIYIGTRCHEHILCSFFSYVSWHLLMHCFFSNCPYMQASSLMLVGLLGNKAALAPKLLNSLIRSVAEVAREEAKELIDLHWFRLSLIALVSLVQVLVLSYTCRV